MNWTKDRSILLSRLCVLAFALALLVLDAGCPWIVDWVARTRMWEFRNGRWMMLSIYSGSILAWLCLWQLWRLLGSIRQGRVFDAENVRRMRIISWCCAGAAAISLLSALYYLPFGFVAVAAGFMALIVRIVKNAFQQAIAMKDELDLTV